MAGITQILLENERERVCVREREAGSEKDRKLTWHSRFAFGCNSSACFQHRFIWFVCESVCLCFMNLYWTKWHRYACLIPDYTVLFATRLAPGSVSLSVSVSLCQYVHQIRLRVLYSNFNFNI